MRVFDILRAAESASPAAIPSASPSATAAPYEGFGGGEILSLITMLLVMGGIIVACWFVTRLIARGGLGAARGTGRLRTVDRLMLARDRMVAVVELDGSYYLIGVAQGSITLLSRIEGDIYQDDAPQEQPRFLAMLQRHREKAVRRDTTSFESMRQTTVSPRDDVGRMIDRVRSRTDELKRKSEGNVRDAQDGEEE